MVDKVVKSFFTLIVAFFLFSFSVSADTTIYYTDNYYSFNPFDTLQYLPTMLNTINNYVDVNLSDKNYAIIYQKPTRNDNFYYVVYTDTNTQPVRFRGNSLQFIFPTSTKLKFSSDFTSLSSGSGFGTTILDNYTSTLNDNFSLLIYSNYDVPYGFYSNASNYIFTDSVNSYVVLPSATTYFPSVYYLDNLWNGDSMPLLSSFFELVISKLILICDYFTSSYIFLSMFVILIMYSVILLFRRLT